MKVPSALRSILCCFPRRASTSKASRVVHATSLQPTARPLHLSPWSVHSSRVSPAPSSSIIISQPQSHNAISPLPPVSLLASSNRTRFRATFQAQSQARAQSMQIPPQNLQRTQSPVLPRQNWFTRIYGRRWWNSSELREDSTMLVVFSILITWAVNRQVEKWKLLTTPEPEIIPGYQKLKWWERDPSMAALYMVVLTLCLGTASIAWLLCLLA